jgi:hypothetical protein
MAERRGWTTAARRRRLRWFKLTRGQASVDAGGPSALANGAGGGLWRRGHDDGVRGGASVSIGTALTLTEREWRAREEAVVRWEDGGAMLVVLEWLGASCARLWRRRSCRSSAAAATRKKGNQKRNGSAAECGRALA